MQLDFGAIDLAQDDNGLVYPIDVNHTPYWDDNNERLVSELREALHAIAATVT